MSATSRRGEPAVAEPRASSEIQAPPTAVPVEQRGAAGPLTRIDARSGRVGVRDLWRARETAFIFAWRDVKVRYKQSLIGIGWAVLQPVLMMVVFTVIFGKFADFPSQGLPYPVFVYTGILPWTFFAAALTQSSGSVVNSARLVQRVYFPRLLLPIAAVLVPAVDFVFASFVLFAIMAWFGVGVEPTAVLAPLFLLLIAATALGIGALLAAVNVRYRDVPYAVPFLIQIWLYLSPVIYPSAALPGWWQAVLSVNPVVAGITGFRWALTGTPPPSVLELGVGVASAAAIVGVGLFVFRRLEPRFADTI